MVRWASQPPPFQVGSPIVHGDCVGASSGSPYPQDSKAMEWTGRRLRNRLWPRLSPLNLLPLVQLLLPPLLEKRGEKMELLPRG